ncbi:MAG: CHAT domain-containing protein [Fimbriimonadaceae bacterium]|nr:CHAT domain-containing protein [Fimbriimonadaceae bacterium]
MTSHRWQRVALLAACLAVSLPPTSAQDYNWLDEILQAPDAAAWRAKIQEHRERLSTATVRGLGRAAEGLAGEPRGVKVTAILTDIAAALDSREALATAALYRGYVAVAREEWPTAAAAFGQGASLWDDASSSQRVCLAWRAVCAQRLGEPAGDWLPRSLPADARSRPALLAAAADRGALTAWASHCRGELEEDWQRWPAAETWYRRAVTGYEAARLELPLSLALDRLGLVCFYQSKQAECRETYERCLALATRIGNSWQVGRSHLGFAELAMDRAEFAAAEQHLQAAVPPLQEVGPAARIDLARVHYVRATARQNSGQHDSVEAELQLAEAIYRAADSPGGLADCQFVRGTNWIYLGDRARAVAALEDAYREYDRSGNYLGQANVNLKLSHCYRIIGYRPDAQAKAAQALTTFERLGDQPGIANCQRALAALARSAGELDEAERLLRAALAIFERTNDALGQAAAKYQIGQLMAQRGADLEPTIELLLDAMGQAEQAGDPQGAALPALELGLLCARAGDANLAYKGYLKALSLAERTGTRSLMAEALYRLGELCEMVTPPRLEASVENYRMSLEIVEQLRQRAGGQAEQQALQSDYLNYYEALIRVLLKLNRAAEAFAVAEEAHARTLLDMVVDAGVNLNAGLTPEQRAREADLERNLAQLNVRVGRLLALETPPEAELQTTRQAVIAARDALKQYRSELYVTHPELGQQRSANPATAADLAPVLPADTALLAYKLGERGTVGFQVTNRAGVQVKAVNLETTAAAAWELTDAFRSSCASPRKKWQAKGSEVTSKLLQPLLEGLDPGITALVIVPDQALYELPFHALPVGQQVLWERYRISYAASASLLAQTRRRAASGVGGLVTFANPHFGSLVRSIDLQRGTALAELPGTAREAAALAARYGDQAKTYQLQEATEERAKAEIGRYRYVHFATHGLLDSANPLYSSVVLAEPPEGSAEDGQLEARELLGLQLQADLVTLSACETGRGKVQPGEGLLGLSWALTAAGARSIVVSQWKVSDDATEQLMSRFYEQLRQGVDKATALRTAALELRTTREHPFYWAPFILQGAW